MKPQKIRFSLDVHLSWFESILTKRIQHFFKEAPGCFDIPEAPELDGQSSIDQIFAQLQLSWEEKVIVLLALTPHFRPEALDVLFTTNTIINRSFTEFGGTPGKNHGGFLPTKETAVFIIAGNDLQKRIEVTKMLQQDRPLYQQHILDQTSVEKGEPDLSLPLRISDFFLSKIIGNESSPPEFGVGLPAIKIETSLDWSDLVLSPSALQKVMDIKAWHDHEPLIQEQWGLNKFLKPGYRSLFYGPSGTGKTLTASLLGKSLGLPVFKIDMGMVVSKYIGETEKNLARIFDLAEHSNWILFFDEADALFGKRSNVTSSHDRYANQEVSYLLQRIEDFSGLTILASNTRDTFDSTFIRRFQSVVHFQMPSPEQRFILWKNAFSNMQLAENVDLDQLAKKYEISGGDIINILRYVAIQTAKKSSNSVQLEDILQGLRKEMSQHVER